MPGVAESEVRRRKRKAVRSCLMSCTRRRQRMMGTQALGSCSESEAGGWGSLKSLVLDNLESKTEQRGLLA